MAYFTSNTYSLKRKILTFSNKIPKHLSKPEKKFVADMSLQPAIILSASSPTFIHHRKKTINLQILSSSMP